MKIYAILAGPDYDLAFKELESLLQTYSITSPIDRIDEKIVAFDTQALPVDILIRPALTREIGEMFGLFRSKEEVMTSANLIDLRHLSTFKVDSTGFDEYEKRSMDAELGEAICQKGYRVRLKSPDAIIRVIRVGGFIILGKLMKIAKRRWVDRRPRARPFFHPSALHPKLARLLLNLSRVKVGEILLDPFAGTGSILIEGAQIGVFSVGLDLSTKMAKGCRENLLKLANQDSELIVADARHIPIRRADGIATDLPYGRASSKMGIDTFSLRKEVLGEANRLLKKGGVCVIMTPSIELPDEEYEMVLEGRHNLYVHRQLTRTISVFRRR